MQGVRASKAAASLAMATVVAGASTIARAQGTSREIKEEATVPTFTAPASASQVETKADVQATAFSAQNAFFFSKMSKVVYSPKAEVQEYVQGDGTTTGLGFEHFYWFEPDSSVSARSAVDAIHDTESFVAANDEMIMVVFRGTQEASDWVTNLSFLAKEISAAFGLSESGPHVHWGFDDGVDTVWTGVGMHETVKRLYHEDGKNRKLFITGHSLGGALATIAAARLAFVDDMDIAALYTIGSPRVFDRSMAKCFDTKMNNGKALKDKYFRCRNNNDIVPRLVPPPYVHVGTEIYLDRFGHMGTTSILDRILGRLSALLRLSFIDGTNDHSSSEYTRLFKQIVINSKVSIVDKAKSLIKDATHKVIHKEKAKEQEEVIEEAKTAAIEASKETLKVADVPVYDTEKDEGIAV